MSPLVSQTRAPGSRNSHRRYHRAKQCSVTDRKLRLAALEIRVGQDDQLKPFTTLDNEARCLKFVKQINQVFTDVGTTYDSDPGQMSAMIFALVTLWVHLDKCAVAVCPLLRDQLPVFEPELLDVLHVRVYCGEGNIRTYVGVRGTHRPFVAGVGLKRDVWS